MNKNQIRNNYEKSFQTCVMCNAVTSSDAEREAHVCEKRWEK